jgi:PhnB protein
MKTELIPYLNFNGNTEEVLNFYKDALNGEITLINRFGESPMPVDEDYKDKIIHARLVFGGDNMIMMSDGMKGKEISTDGNIQLSIQMEDGAELKSAFDKLSAGGTVTMPLQVQFWGDLFGMLKDKFGVSWMFNCPKK